MTNQRLIVPVVFATAVMLVSPAVAQKFQEPTKEELCMTADPKAPGAPAAYLYLEEKMDVETHVISEYARIKIFSEKGKKYTTVRIPYATPYDSTPVIEARTIHSDGAVIPLDGKARDLLIYQTNAENVKEAAFKMPSVEVGSILEYRWTVFMTGSRSDAGGMRSDFYGAFNAFEIPKWMVQKSIYVHRAHYFYNPIYARDKSSYFGPTTGTAYRSGLQQGRSTALERDYREEVMAFTEYLPPGFKTVKSQAGDYTLDIQDVPATPEETYAPPLEVLRYRVLFYFTPPTTAFWLEAITQWSKELDAFISVSQTLRSAVAQTVAGANTPDAKARQLYRAVQAFDNTDFSKEKSDAGRRRPQSKAVDQS